jgi:hypothetical protein
VIYIEKNGLPPAFIHKLQSLAAFQNPDFYKTQAMRLPTYGKPRVIGCYEDYAKYLAIPRGCFQILLDLMKVHQIEVFLVHPISWKGTLQQYAGRLHRTHQSKQDVQIYDYVDLQVPMLMAMYKKRVKGYQAMGYHGMNL